MKRMITLRTAVDDDCFMVDVDNIIYIHEGAKLIVVDGLFGNEIINIDEHSMIDLMVVFGVLKDEKGD